MAEAAGGESGGSEGVGIEAAIAGIENAAPGDISMGIADTTGTAFEGSSEFGSAGVPDAVSSVGATSPGFGSAGVPDALSFDGGSASRDMGISGGIDAGQGGSEGRGGEKGAPPMEKPKAQDNREDVMLGPADRRRRASQRADSASVTLTDNEAYLLGGNSAKRKDARRVLLGP